MKTGNLSFICGFCNKETAFGFGRSIWNFDNPIYAHSVGYCSEQCIKDASTEIEINLMKNDSMEEAEKTTAWGKEALKRKLI